MFDVGFSEMLVIGIVALVVIGPERLPSVARTIGHLMGRAQRYVNDVKRDIDREMQVEELRKLQTQMQETARSIETSVTVQVGEVQSELDKAQGAVNQFAEQANDLTRLDDPLAAKTEAQPVAATAPGTSAVVEAGSDADMALVAESNFQSGSAETAESAVVAEPAAAGQPVQPSAASPVVEPEAEPDVGRSRHELDHMETDYSESFMPPNTTISQSQPAAQGGSSGTAGTAATAGRTVLVHVDVPPVT